MIPEIIYNPLMGKIKDETAFIGDAIRKNRWIAILIIVAFLFAYIPPFILVCFPTFAAKFKDAGPVGDTFWWFSIPNF